MTPINVLVNGCAGRMGQEVVRALVKEPDLKLVAGVDLNRMEEDIGTAAGISPLGIRIASDLGEAIQESKAQVVVDFTHPKGVMRNIETILKSGAACVVGTTGISEPDLKTIEKWCESEHGRIIIAPNFAIGAVLMMSFARQAARHFPNAEIIELHHEKKEDYPSGTALRTAEMMAKEQKDFSDKIPTAAMILKGEGESDKIVNLKNARGGELQGIHLHSIRLPGLVAHQEVLLGGLGQTLSIRHDTISREAFMPGVILAIRKAPSVSGLIYGLENLLD